MSITVKAKNEILYCVSRLYYMFNRPQVRIMSIDETIDYLSVEGNSIVRFGDGEFSIISQHKIDNYQDVNEQLAEKLKKSLMFRGDKILICLPETLCNMSLCSNSRISRVNWFNNYFRNKYAYKNYIDKEYVYGNAFVSRTYLIYPDKSKCDEWFSRLRGVFKDRDLLLIEGKYSRSGVGNDLFSEAKSIKRIICPPLNAFNKYNEILETARKNMNGKLVLLALGPTSKPLAVELAMNGAWVIDIGHLDSEYEWFLSGAKEKVKIAGKHTPEKRDANIEECTDVNYLNSIIKIIK